MTWNPAGMPPLAAPPQLTGEMTHHVTRASRLIFDHAGIIVPKHKEAATARTLQALSERHFDANVGQLLDRLEASPSHEAWPEFVSAFTINHTAFFRESHHLEHLADRLRSHGPCAIWCAAASTGEEPYTIAMTVNEVLGERATVPQIHATDIDAKAIALAKVGIYDVSRMQGLDEDRIKRHFLRGIDDRNGKVKIKPAVSRRVNFDTFNLNGSSWSGIGPFDVAFCRNTMIYFDKETQTRLLSRFASAIKPGGLLYIGHSESVTALTNQFRLLGQTVYQRV